MRVWCCCLVLGWGFKRLFSFEDGGVCLEGGAVVDFLAGAVEAFNHYSEFAFVFWQDAVELYCFSAFKWEDGVPVDCAVVVGVSGVARDVGSCECKRILYSVMGQDCYIFTWVYTAHVPFIGVEFNDSIEYEIVEDKFARIDYYLFYL